MMGLPKHVLEAATVLEKTKDYRLQTLCNLTQPREIKEDWDDKKDYPVERNYKDMWNTIERHERKNGNDLASNQWVLDFLDDVIDAQKLPKYMCLANDERIDLIMKINSLTTELYDIFLANKNNINPRIKKALDRKNLKIKKSFTNQLSLEKIDIMSALNFHSEFLIKEISSAESLTQQSKGIEYRMFLTALARRNMLLYNKKLLEVVSTAGWAIFGVNTSISTITNIILRSQKI